jgi:hypothetical protein
MSELNELVTFIQQNNSWKLLNDNNIDTEKRVCIRKLKIDFDTSTGCVTSIRFNTFYPVVFTIAHKETPADFKSRIYKFLNDPPKVKKIN